MIHLLICGISTRAAAASAARAGFRVTAIDGFADLDQHPAVRALSLPRDFGVRATPSAAARAARGIDADAAVYLSSFENHPRAVAALASGRALWGNPPDVLRRVRDPLAVAAALRRHGFAVPAVVMPAGRQGPPSDSRRSPRDWLIKPLRSGGGQRVRAWTGGAVPRHCYLQERIAGTPGSIVFAAARGRAVPLGISRQLVGDAAFGAKGYRYCGSIIAGVDDPHVARGARLFDAASALASAMAAEFDLRGVNGIDFIARDGVPYAIEVNPRWSASMELIEPLLGFPAFRAHADACAREELPAVDLPAALARTRAIGKAVVFARGHVVAQHTAQWLDDPMVRDVPPAGQRFAAGQPICTVLAGGDDAAQCYKALVQKAAGVYEALEHALTAPVALKESVRA